MEHTELPKKLLHVEDLTFVLPDDFEGGLEDAFHLLLDYIHDAMSKSVVTGKSDAERLFTVLSAENERKMAISYGIFELGEDKKTYYLR